MKKIVIGILSVLLGLTIAIGYLPQNVTAAEAQVQTTAIDHQVITDVTESQYLSNIQGINVPNGEELIKLIRSDKSYFLFIGYQECPYCRAFSSVLASFKAQSKLPIYYVNLDVNYSTDLTADKFNELQSFFNEKIGPLYTPTFVRMEHQNPVSGFVGGSTTLEQLQSINH